MRNHDLIRLDAPDEAVEELRERGSIGSAPLRGREALQDPVLHGRRAAPEVLKRLVIDGVLLPPRFRDRVVTGSLQARK